MKITGVVSFLICASTILVFAAAPVKGQSALDKPVSITIQNESLQAALEKLGRQANVTFSYAASAIFNSKTSLKVRQEKLSAVLDALLDNYPYTYVALNDKIILRYSAEKLEKRKALLLKQQQQQHVLNGVVLDEKGGPLPGAAVRVKGTTRAVVADVNGKFLIEITDPKEVLQITYLGYFTLEVPAGTERDRTFTLSPDLDKARLNEVVVVGFGAQKKATVTGAVSSVSIRDLERTGTPSISNAIAGRLPGIITRQSSGEPGFDQAQIFIRGMGTWMNRAPFVIIDGVPRDNLDLLNTMEIESFTVLKDAAATAVYGVRGANGVILINTRKGIQGKPKVVFRSEVATLAALRLPDYINAAEYATLMNEGLVSSGAPARWTAGEIQTFADGSDPYFYPNVNWTDAVLKRNTYQTTNNLNVNGGDKIVRYFANVGYTEQSGFWKEDPNSQFQTNSNVKRYNFRSNVDINVTENLILELGIGGIIQSGNFPGTSAPAIFENLNKVPPIAFPMLNPDGSISGSTGFIGNNPYGLVTRTGYVRQDKNTVQGTFSARWDLSKNVTKGLSLNGRFAYDHSYFGNQIRTQQFEVKQYLGINPDGTDNYNTPLEGTPLGYDVVNTAIKSTYFELKADYNRSFGDHNLSGLLLANQREYIDITAGTSIANLPQRSRGFSGRATYNFKDTYLLEGNFGYNGSENFPKGQRFGFFPSVSAGWVISNEKFWGSDNVINQFKIRGSHGKVGNDQIGGRRFLFLTNVRTSGAESYQFGDGMIPYAGIDEDALGNPNVTWEVSTKSNLGLDLELYKGKIILQLDAFYEDRVNILLQRTATTPAVAGFYQSSIPYANLGKAKNKGIDGMLEIRNTTQKGLYYSLRGNFTFARNRIVENAEAEMVYAYQSGKGRPIDQPFALEALGLFKDQQEINSSPLQSFSAPRPGDIKYKDQNGDNVINDYDRVFTGYARTPEITFGFGGTMAYKGFDFSLFFNGASRTNLFLNGSSMYPFLNNMGTNNVLREYYDNRWTPQNPNGLYPAAANGNSPNNFRPNTLYMKDGSYIRLRNAELGYTLPKTLTTKLGMSTLRLFANGLNLYTWDKIKVIDPESENGTGGYPLQRSLNFGLQVNFK